MNIVYQIKFGGKWGGVAYTRNIADCDSLCARMIDEGIYPKVRRMQRKDVPLSDLELVNNL